jgi:DNA-binding NtrC family response regulator
MKNPFPKAKILVVDDDLNLQSGLKRLLVKENFIVEVASNGKDGLSKVGDFEPDCHLLDIGMPILDGNKTLGMIKWLYPKATKQKWFDSKTAVIIVSGAKNFKPQEEWIADGAFGFVSKPINFEELYPLIIQALESKTTEHESRQQL